MKAVEYIGNVLADGHLEIPATVKHELQLCPNEQVQVVLIPTPKTAEDDDLRAAERSEAWRQVDILRKRLSGKNFSLTDSLLQAREEEDASL